MFQAVGGRHEPHCALLLLPIYFVCACFHLMVDNSMTMRQSVRLVGRNTTQRPQSQHNVKSQINNLCSLMLETRSWRSNTEGY